MSRRLQVALFLLLAVWTGRVAAQGMAEPGTYRVQIVVRSGDDGAAVAKGVAATYGGHLESPVDAEDTVTMIIDGSVLSLLERDPRVRQVQSADESKAATPQPATHSLALPARTPAPRLQTNSTATPWTTGTYAYDAAGNVTEIGVDRFGYDVYSRIKSGTAAGQTQEYTYDRYGNLTSIKTGTTTIPLTANTTTNRLTAVNGSSLTYDAAGQLLQAGTASYTYDGTGMMTSSGTSGVPSNLYIYTPSDERIASVLVTSGAEVSSTWSFRDASGKVLRRFDKQNQSGTWTWVWRQDYIYGGSQMLASENDASPKTRHYFPDHLGTPRLITDGGGMQVGLAAYLPFGEPALASGVSDAKKFTGHERDPSGLDYMHARYYNWGWGRFLSVDPAMDLNKILPTPQRWNRYSYVSNNPINKVDPDGREELFYQEQLFREQQMVGDGQMSIDTYWARRRAEGQAGLLGASIVGGGLLLRSAWGAASMAAMSSPGAVLMGMKILDAMGGNVGGHINPAGQTGGKLGFLLGNVASEKSIGRGGFFAGVMGFTAKTLDGAIRSHFADNFKNGVLQKDGRLAVTGAMTGANGVVATVKTVWQWNQEKRVWDLITSVPAR